MTLDLSQTAFTESNIYILTCQFALQFLFVCITDNKIQSLMLLEIFLLFFFFYFDFMKPFWELFKTLYFTKLFIIW